MVQYICILATDTPNCPLKVKSLSKWSIEPEVGLLYIFTVGFSTANSHLKFLKVVISFFKDSKKLALIVFSKAIDFHAIACTLIKKILDFAAYYN